MQLLKATSVTNASGSTHSSYLNIAKISGFVHLKLILLPEKGYLCLTHLVESSKGVHQDKDDTLLHVP